MHGARCPSCDIRTTLFHKQILKGWGLAPFPCQGCGTMLAKSPRALLPALLPILALPLLAIGLMLSPRGTPSPSTSLIVFRVLLLLAGYGGLYLGSIYLAWRYFPLRDVTREVQAVEAGRRPGFGEASANATIPAALFGVLGYIFGIGQTNPIQLALVTFGFAWAVITLVQWTGTIYRGPDGKTAINGWKFSGLSGAVILALWGAQDPPYLLAAGIWPVLLFAVWWVTRKLRAR